MRHTQRVLWIVGLAMHVGALILIYSATTAAKAHHWVYVGPCLMGTVVFLIVGHIFWRFHDRASQAKINRLRQDFDQLDMVPTLETNHLWLDLGKLHLWTTDLMELGFSSLGDYTINAGELEHEDLRVREPFVRVLANEKRHCFAEIGQSCRNKTEVMNMNCGFLTVLTSGDQCRTSNDAPPPEMARKLMPNTFYEQNASPTDLLRAHISQRDKLIVEKGLVVQEDMSYEAYHQHVLRQKLEVKERANQLISGITGKQDPMF